MTSFQTPVILLFWFLPTLLWQGDPIPDGNDAALEGGIDAVEGLEEEELDFVTKAIRANLCPNCVLNIILVDTLIVSFLLVHRFNLKLNSETFDTDR